MKLIDDLTSDALTLPEGKSATTYVLLAVFLGTYGVHNLWAGNPKGQSQLIAGLISTCLCCSLPNIVLYVLALFDVAKIIENLRAKA